MNAQRLRWNERRQRQLLLEQLGLKQEKKMSVSPNVWSDLPSNYKKNIAILRDRCESDVVGLETLY